MTLMFLMFTNSYNGKIIWKVVPFPGSESTVIFPLKCALILEYDINNPNPVPFFPYVVTISLNNLSFTTSDKPGP